MQYMDCRLYTFSPSSYYLSRFVATCLLEKVAQVVQVLLDTDDL